MRELRLEIELRLFRKFNDPTFDNATCDAMAPPFSYPTGILMFTHRSADPLATSHKHTTSADKLPLPRIFFLV
jgi:hypothetical protein